MASSPKDILAAWDNPASRRRYRRWAVDLPIYVDVDGVSHYCMLFDISPSGARLRVVDGAAPNVDAEVVFDLEGYGRIRATVRHGASGIVGLQFLHDEAAQVRLAHWLIRAKPTRRQARHACRIAASLRYGDLDLPCLVTDISRSGAAVEIEGGGHLVTSCEVELLLPGYQPITASVRHIAGTKIGLMLIDGFHGELPDSRPANVVASRTESRKAGGRV